MKRKSFYQVLIGLVFIIGSINCTPPRDRVVEVYTIENTYYCNIDRLSVKDEAGIVQREFKSFKEMADWISDRTANDSRAIDDNQATQEWVITNKCTIITAPDSSVYLNLGGTEVYMPYQERDPNGNCYYYYVD